MIIIFDLDGTLADSSHRIPIIADVERAPSHAAAWAEFWSSCPVDKPIASAIAIFRALLYSSERYDLEIWTGRSESVRAETEDWLSDNVFRGNWWLKKFASLPAVPLKMRRTGDWRPDAEVKGEWLDELRAEGREVTMAFEDRARLVKFWRERGVFCLQCADDQG